MAGAAFLGKLGRAMYRGATSRAGATGIVAGAAALGFASKAAPAARDAAMDVAFGDPNADETFLGRKLTPGAVADSMIPGGKSGTGALVATGALGTIRSSSRWCCSDINVVRRYFVQLEQQIIFWRLLQKQ